MSSFTSESKTSRLLASGSYERVILADSSALLGPVGAGSFTSESKTSRSGFGLIAARKLETAVYLRSLRWLVDGQAGSQWTVPPGLVWHADGSSEVQWTPSDAADVSWACDGAAALEWFGIGTWRCNGQAQASWGHAGAGPGAGWWNANGQAALEWITTPPVTSGWKVDGRADVMWWLRPGGVGQDCLTGDGIVAGGGAPVNHVF